MQDNPLQQLRDVHTPVAPEWWPPAPGWWLLCIAAVVGTVFISKRLWRAHRARSPIRSARTLIGELKASHNQGQIDTLRYVHDCNEVLKRLLSTHSAFDIWLQPPMTSGSELWIPSSTAANSVRAMVKFSVPSGFRLRHLPMSRLYIKLFKRS